MADRLESIAIIGAGLGGAALAVSLSSAFPRTRITLFESRPAGKLPSVTSGVILTPNGLSILDSLAILPLIKDKCYVSTYRCFKDRNDLTTEKLPVALKEQYGYSNHRLWRNLLLDTMLEVLSTRDNVQLIYERRLVDILPPSSDHSGVAFSVSKPGTTTPETQRADLLIGADGINSAIRRILHPNIEPEYTGTTALITHIPRASVAWPSADYEHNATIQDIPGAILFLPEDPASETIMVGKQMRDIPASSITNKKTLDELQNNKDKLCELFCSHYEEYGATARKILDSIRKRKEEIYLWPFMRIPLLSTWYREHDGRVLFLGDAAHAIPPSSGQGVNQVLEDVWMLTLLLKAYSDQGAPVLDHDELLDCLRFWQESRQKRIDQIYDWAVNVRNVARLSIEERREVEAKQGQGQKKPVQSKSSDEMAWLYAPRIEEQVGAWLETRAQKINNV